MTRTVVSAPTLQHQCGFFSVFQLAFATEPRAHPIHKLYPEFVCVFGPLVHNIYLKTRFSFKSILHL